MAECSDDVIKMFKGRYKFLSNFYSSCINYHGDVYSTAEHLFQALKTGSKPLRERVRLAKTPTDAKRIGQVVHIRIDWEDIKTKIMYTVVHLKFIQNRRLEKLLFDTGEAELIEGNFWHDNYWGNCICFKCKYIEGKNQLGKILMVVRSEIL